MTDFHKSGIETIKQQRKALQDKLDSRLPNNADVLRTQPFNHPQKQHKQFKSKGLGADLSF